MLEDFSYLSLKERGFIPSDVVELDSEYISKNLKVFSLKDSVNSSGDDFGLIVDNYLWVVKSDSTGMVYSSDGKFAYGYSNLSETEGEYIKYLLKDKLVPINKIKINRRNDTMSDKNEIAKKLEQMKETQNQKMAEKANAMADSNAFTGEAKPAVKEMTEEERLKKLEQDAKIEGLNKAIKNLSSGVNLTDTSDLHAYNQPRSGLIGWIVDRDVRLHAKAKADLVIDPTTKKPKLKGNATQEVRDLLASGKRPAREYLEETVKLSVNQMAPGAAKFAIVEMPVDGIIPIDKLRDPNYEIKLDFKSSADRVVKFYNKKEFVATTIALLGGSIKEDPRTNDEPTVVNTFLKGKPVTDKETGRVENKLVPSITTTSKRKLITATNYFPKTTFAKLRLDEINSQEARDKANLSLFGHLFRVTGGKPTPFSKLDPSEKAKISLKDGKVESKFFDPANSIPLEVNNVFTGTAISNPEIPLKEELPTKDGKGTRLVPVTFDVTRSTEDPHGIDPFKDPRFARIREACGGFLTPQVIADLYAKSKRRKKTASASGIILSAEEATKIYLGAANLDGQADSSLKNLNFSDALTSDELREFSAAQLQDLSGYYASK